MNILFLTLLYHPEDVAQTLRLSRDGLQNQINSYQWALVDGLRQNMGAGESLSILNALPVGVFPTRYRKLFLPTRRHEQSFMEIGSLNLPWCKQHARAKRAERAMEHWVAASPENRTLLLYTLYLPFMKAVAAVKLRHPELKASVIVTDLPNELGISSGRKGLLKRIEFLRGKQSMELAHLFDGYVLLTNPMADALAVRNRPIIVLEGLITEQAYAANDVSVPADARPAILYTGTLNRELGIGELLEAFGCLPDVQLWLCGRGDMESEVRRAVAGHENIRYFGFVPQADALALQAKADALINPRTAQGAFTRYSFPSKTLEYMRCGKPVLCCKLEGIPAEYDAYLRYIQPQNVQGIRDTVKSLLALPAHEREAIGQKAKAFALENKNSRVQCARLLGFLRQL